MKNTEFLNRLWVALSCDKIKFCYLVVDADGGYLQTIARTYKSTPKRVAWVIFASNKYTVYKG